MQQYRYKDYTEYVDAQRDGFERKRNKVWASEENIAAISTYLKARGVKNGICHGVRGGHEVRWFRDFLDAYVIGTEIGEPYAPYIVQWDFNKPCAEWIRRFDFVYSNAFDHAYNPAETLRVWAEQLKPGGVLVIETDERNEHTGKVSKPVNKTDPTGITLDELIELLETVGPAEVLDLPFVTYGYRKALVVSV